MVRRSSKIHPLPTWFQLTNYDQLPKLTNLGLFEETWIRVHWLFQPKAVASQLPDMSLWEAAMVSGIHSQLGLRGSLALYWMRPNITTHTKSEQFTEQGLAISPHVYPLGRLPDTTKSKRPDLVNVGISLIDSTDAEILAELAQLLPLWRKQLTLPEPTKSEVGTVGPSAIRRIIDYKVIPMLDLMLWAKIEGFEYSAEQLSRILFPDEIVTAKHMTDTRIPFAKNFANHNYQNMISLWLRQTGRDGKLNGDRLVGDECHDLTSIARQ